jgi:glutamate racemase
MTAPIGVFDSGLGGLSVVRQLQSELPRESILYAADSLYCPYGERPLDEIRERSLQMVGMLVQAGAKLVIVACNTASAAAIDVLRATYHVPIVAMEPAVKPAVALTRTGRIAVLATPSTAASTRLRALIDRYGAGFDIRAIGVPGLADCVETGRFDGPEVRLVLEDRVRRQVKDGVDVMVLGCTHYPFVSEVIRGNAVARRAREVLMQFGLLNGLAAAPRLRLHTSGALAEVLPIVERMLGQPVHPEALDLHSVAVAD